ncbi:MAG: ImmA/IrrE family metallo-endopeptidase [Pseudomonadota bacterium]
MARPVLEALALGFAMLVQAGPAALAYSDMYPPTEIARDAHRLETAVRKIYRRGLAPALSRRERARLGKIALRFPAPKPDDALLNFYAYTQSGVGHVVMPILSLKQLEDLATAYAWLQVNRKSLSSIDLYFAMLRHKLVIDFPGGRFPDILSALGLPKDAHTQRGVDTLSLSLRNEAFAFIIAHELGHILYRHKPYADITKPQARADELQSDRFALDLLVRTNTPPMGAVLFFQAQAHAMPHRGQFATEAEWTTFLNKAATHPMSTERIALMAGTFSGPLARRRPSEAATWRAIGVGVLKINRILEEVAIQRCIAKTASASSLDDLKPSRAHVGLAGCQSR